MSRWTSVIAVAATASVLMLVAAVPALAEQAWRLDPLSNTTVAPGAELSYYVEATNIGDTALDGSQIDLRARLPLGMTVVRVTARNLASLSTINCFDGADGTSSPVGATSVVCSAAAPLAPWRAIKAQIVASVPPSASGEEVAEFSVSGGGAATMTNVETTRVTAEAPTFGFDAFDGSFSADASGAPMTQAGGHPYSGSVSIDFATFTHPRPLLGALSPVEPVKNVLVDLPVGLAGDPTILDECSLPDLANADAGFSALPLCSPESQVGTALVRLKGAETTGNVVGPLPVFNIAPPPDKPARFGFNVVGSVVVMDAEVRSSSDYGLSINVRNVPEALAIMGTTVDFWGVPAARIHDRDRACPGNTYPADGGPSCESGADPDPLLRAPTSCTDPNVGLETTARIDSWVQPGVFKTSSWRSHSPPGYPLPPHRWGPELGVTGCDRVPFEASFSARPVEAKAGRPSAFAFDLSIDRSEPNGISPSDLRRAVVTLPAGVRVSPSSADGLGACAPNEIRIGDGTSPSCPPSSRIGTVTIDTPVLRNPLQGSIYLARQRDNPFGSLLSIYLVAEGQGVVVKLAGRVDADPLSGQLKTTFDNNPQLPFSNLHLEFKGGPRAALAVPRQCGTYRTHAELTGWSGSVVVSESSFQVTKDGNGAPCAGPKFQPGFSAGMDSSGASGTGRFSLRMTRDDDDEELKAIDVKMPDGLTGRIANVELCSAASASSGSCPERSRVGSVVVGAGAGPNPFFVRSGRVYITEGYKSAPFGLSIVVPAVAGPFDLGTVVVQSSIFVDKLTAQLRVVSDPLPTVLEGIPLDVRDVRVSIDRTGFMVNPTSCAPKEITGALSSYAGQTANVSARFQARGCANLGFRPRMVLRVGGRRSTQRGRPTAFSTSLRMPAIGANLRYVRVTLPMTLNARLTVINDACTRDAFERGECRFAKAGTATAVTPLLRDPLKGDVFFVRNGNPLPDLIVALRGQVAFDLVGRITIPGSKRLRTTFDRVPDVPISSFSLRLVGGRNASIGNATNQCSRRGRTARAELDFIGQNGRVSQVDTRLKIAGCKKRASGPRRARGGVRGRRRR